MDPPNQVLYVEGRRVEEMATCIDTHSSALSPKPEMPTPKYFKNAGLFLLNLLSLRIRCCTWGGDAWRRWRHAWILNPSRPNSDPLYRILTPLTKFRPPELNSHPLNGNENPLIRCCVWRGDASRRWPRAWILNSSRPNSDPIHRLLTPLTHFRPPKYDSDPLNGI